jgi:hypothetical protein
MKKQHVASLSSMLVLLLFHSSISSLLLLPVEVKTQKEIGVQSVETRKQQSREGKIAIDVSLSMGECQPGEGMTTGHQGVRPKRKAKIHLISCSISSISLSSFLRFL